MKQPIRSVFRTSFESQCLRGNDAFAVESRNTDVKGSVGDKGSSEEHGAQFPSILLLLPYISEWMLIT